MTINLLDPILTKLFHLLQTCGWISMDTDSMEAIGNRAGCAFFHGVSKGCFMHNSWDFVIKIPYYGFNASKDYCAEEEIAYLEIKEKYPLCSGMFAETEYLCTCGEIPVYAQRKIFQSVDELLWNHHYDWFIKDLRKYSADLSSSSKDFARDYDKVIGSRISSLFCAAIVRAYGYKAFKTLCKWIVDTDQNDLHASNIGFTEDLYPIIFDFSGWYDNDDSSGSSFDSELASL